MSSPPAEASPHPSATMAMAEPAAVPVVPSAMQKILELKAANNVRRVIAKVKLATPENFEEGQNELFDTLEKELANLGDELHTKLQEEAVKAIEFGQARVDGLAEKRKEDEVKWQSHREIMAEIDTHIEVLQLRTQDLKDASGLEPGVEMTADDVESVERLVKEMVEEVTEFTKSCAELISPKAAEMKLPELPAEIKKSWGESALKVNKAKQEAVIAATKARTELAKAQVAQKTALLEEAKELFKDRLKDVVAPVRPVEVEVLRIEELMMPLSKNKATKERLPLCDEVEAAIVAAKVIVGEAKTLVCPPTEDEGIDEKIKAEFDAWLRSEVKRPIIRLGQLENRLGRVSNISRNFRRDIGKVAAAAVLAELKPKLLEKVKAKADSNATMLAKVDQAIKAAEKAIEPFVKSRGLEASEMEAIHTAAIATIQDGVKVVAEARKEICPIEEGHDEQVKKKLEAFIAKEVRLPMLRLGGMERRLNRAQNLAATFAKGIEKKRASLIQEVRLNARRVLLYARAAKKLSPQQLYALITKGSEVKKTEFLAFFASADKTIKGEGLPAEGEKVELPPASLEKLFESYCAAGKTTIPKAAFIAKVLTSYMKVSKGTLLTSELSIKAEGEKLRLLKVGEVVETLEGPVKESEAGLMRIRCRAVSDKVEGWATVAGNAGTVLLKDHDGPK